MSYKVTLIPGDGIGPEVIEAAKICVDSTGIDILWEEKLIGSSALSKTNSLLPGETIESIQNNRIALKGPATTPVGKSFRSVNVALRKRLDLYVNLRPVSSRYSIHKYYKGVDIIIVRENTEDLYAGVEFNAGDESALHLLNLIKDKGFGDFSQDSAISLKIISRPASLRIAKFAFEYARENKRQKVSCVHKANILKFTDGLFLNSFYETAKKYPDMQADDYIIDNLSMQLVSRPNKFDVLVLPNLYGDIISDLCAGLIGGLGVAPGANIGKDIAVFEPVHGSAPKYAGKNRANPSAAILSAALMLRHMGEKASADKIERAVEEIIKENKFVTYDLKIDGDMPKAVGTLQMAEKIAERIKSY